MPIQAGDIKLLKSVVMDDVPEGGGARSANVILDASTNSIFPDISELDRAGGRVNLRKLYPQVRTPDNEGYFGANVVIAKPFADPRVSATLFETPDPADRRADAASRMEAYLARGTPYSGYLFGDHIEGQMTVALLQRLAVALPVVGQTLVLTKNQGLVSEFQQFVRVTSVEATERVFEDGLQPDAFTRRQVILGISDRLGEDFFGFDAMRYDATLNYTGKTRVHGTIVADAAEYFGTRPLEDAVAIGDYSAKADTIFNQLVPSTRVEVPIADARMTQQLSLPVATGSDISRSLTQIFSPSQAMFVGGSITPGSFSLSRGAVTLADRGGLLTNGGSQVGTIDYDNGVLTLSADVFGNSPGTHSVAYRAAVIPAVVNRGIALPVTAESQRLSYVTTLDPQPVKGSTQVSYRALGNWYTLTDDGSGALRGADSTAGAGSLSSIGTLSVTLGAYPDVGTKVLINWANPAKVKPVPPAGPVDQSPPSTAVAQKAGRRLQFPTPRPIKPGTLSISWNDGTARTVTDNSSRGLIGYGTGLVDYAQGWVWWQPTTLPPKGTVVTLSIGEVENVFDSLIELDDDGANWGFELGPNVTPRTFTAAIVWLATPTEAVNARPSALQQRSEIYDNGSGLLVFKSNVDSSEIPVGTVNYTTGACTLAKVVPGLTLKLVQDVAREDASVMPPMRWTETVFAPAAVSIAITGQAHSVAYVNSGTDTPQTVDITLDFVEYRLEAAPVAGVIGGSGPPVYPGDVYLLREFTLGPNRYSVVGGTTIVMNVSPTTGAGTPAGTYTASTNTAAITLWGDQAAPASTTPPAVTGAAAAAAPSGPAYAAEIAVAVFRTAVSPLLNGGFSVAGNYIDGTPFSATANSGGFINTGSAAVSAEVDGTLGVFGFVDYESGVAEIRWGRRTLKNPATNPFVVDISELGIAGVTTILMEVVAADTLRYNAVGYSYLPLDPEILGLNPVRLPPDGRVPIFRAGSFAVLMHTGTVGPAAVTNGQTLSAGRERLSRVRILGSDDLVIDEGYTADLDAGTVTFDDVSGYAQPIRLEHTVEDMMVVRDAQINGRLSFTRPSTHVYPVPGSYVASALVQGDVRARVGPCFDQVAWTNAWADAPIGSPATGTYNDTQHPIVATNLGAITGRWALVIQSGGTTFQIISEHLGVIGTGNLGSDCAPINPDTGAPFFTLQSEGWGLGWSAGNVLLFPTYAAGSPFWCARTILQGPATVENDSFLVVNRGDVDRP